MGLLIYLHSLINTLCHWKRRKLMAQDNSVISYYRVNLEGKQKKKIKAVV